ncbi:methylenetetrahydrofolate reductase (NAD(P)H) MET13 KNAG_0F02500 [Huiozyma naganishii CBS 8797]|uniref:MTHFR SAM-binding regulatory domain-containing protein n=1 Tax=Huiozyma naganishii (strain ATCC MYA-139 / BCRC 22969 / CBS 8797 / KCTC 17520 / NBRC 10181 / NCYC 3082 / Yp74L-3) TaxID=1071383 RepID=J7R7R4_HUIN7|nr:hypothetical protein KNAG_0F02500 [Kazachstania naganishii CBS 8797]CCK70915.1 hypothetical protein KNAG_0F02500 [Kazachstania naganishii CBS 8797]
MKITDKLHSYHELSGKPTFSFEYFVPKTEQGVQNLYDRMDRMYEASLPQFVDITWNAGGGSNSTNRGITQQSTDLVATAQSVLGLETCMHLTCTNMPVQQIDNALESAFQSGCQNLLALRGDPPRGPLGGGDGDEWQPVEGGFRHASDLVRYIRAKYGDHFNIGVAGYPEGHPEEKNPENNLLYLREKVDAGADFIITQMFYDAGRFVEWCRQVRQAGVEVPIIPGIMPITTFAAFLRRASWGSVHIPQRFLDVLTPIKDDDELVREMGTALVVQMCQTVLDSGYVNHLHIYTMNLEKAPLMILERLRLLPTDAELVGTGASLLPWRKSLNPNRRREEVRPIFWKKRPYSYVARTSQWAEDEFPNGRFGDSSSPAFGDLDLCGSSLIRQSRKRALELWSTPRTLNDLGQLVNNYLTGKIVCLPWSDTPLDHEVDTMLTRLLHLNSNGIFTINSQPQINGVRSNDKIHGWGPRDGYVYQKQYLEFLLPRGKLASLQSRLQGNEIMTYFAIDRRDDLVSNHPDGSRANAVTWGIFPGREVLQPTIVERVSFLAWKEEFYRILEEWKLLLKENNENESASLIDTIINEYYLINIVDNDYISQEDNIYNLLTTL